MLSASSTTGRNLARLLVAATVAATLVATGCAGPRRDAEPLPTPPPDPAAARAAALQARLREAERLYQRGQLSDAAPLFEGVAEDVLAADDGTLREVGARAAQRAVLCYQELASRQSFTPAGLDAQVPIPMRDADRDLARALTRALRYLTDDRERSASLRYLLGRLYYKYNHLEQALTVMTELIEQAPDLESACAAARLCLDILKLQQAWATLTTTARDLARHERLACGSKDRAAFTALEMQAAYKQVEAEQQDSRDPRSKAQAFLGYAERYPTSELACPAIYTAVVTLQAAELAIDESRARKILKRACADWAKRQGL